MSDKKKLSDQDGRVVDYLLDRQDSEQLGGVGVAKGVVMETTDLSAQHIETVQQVLTLLGELPAEEPPGDLKIKTLRRVDAAIGALNNAAAIPPPADRREDRDPSA